MENRTYRMYGMVPYNILEIQKGIQFGHAVQEYNNFVKDLSFKYLENRELPKNEFSILNSFEKLCLRSVINIKVLSTRLMFKRHIML